MPTRRLLLKTILFCALLLAAPAAHAATDDVTVRLQVNAGHPALPGWRDCMVTVPAGSNVGDVLDQAEEDGCITQWSYDTFPGFGRYVTSIDHVPGAIATYWAFYVGGFYANEGIDDTIVAEGSTYKFTYEQWVVPLPSP